MHHNYCCKNCMLSFDLGSTLFDNRSSGYEAITYLVCASCGTQHAIQHAMTDRGPEEYDTLKIVITKVPDNSIEQVSSRVAMENMLSKEDAMKLVLSLPYACAERVRKEIADLWEKDLQRLNIEYFIEPNGKMPNKSFGPIQKDLLLRKGEPIIYPKSLYDYDWAESPILGNKEGVTESFLVEVQKCYFCNTIGGLVKSVNIGSTPCPKCGVDELFNAGYTI